MTSPYPKLPLRVAQHEIADGISPLEGCQGYAGIHLLLRRRGIPLGWVTLGVNRDHITATEVAFAMRQRLQNPMSRAVLFEALPPTVLQSFPAISVVICSRDRAGQLERCLRAISMLEYPVYEVVVVDNAPRTDATQRVATAAGARYVVEDRPGLDWARNRGLAAAKYDIIAYTDDDTEVDARWLAAIATGFADPAVAAMAGLIIPATLDTEAEVLFELCYGGMGKGTQPRRWDPSAMSGMQRIDAHHVGAGANMAFRRALLEHLGGFDTALDVGTPANGGGDLDIFHRAFTAGAVIQYQPSAIVSHHHRREIGALRRQHYDNGRAFGVYLLKVFRRGSVSRGTTAWYAVRVWLGWLVGRVFRRFLRRERLPMPLLLAELWGASHAPWACLASYLNDRALRRRSG